MSHVALGKQYDASKPEARRMAEGISVNATLAQARSRARSFNLGRYVAEIRIPGDASLTVERTGTNRGHYTIWGEPSVIMGCVVSIVRADVDSAVD